MTSQSPPVPKKPRKKPLTVRAGDFLRVADSLRLALELAEAAIDVAERRGPPVPRVGADKVCCALRQQVLWIRRSA